MNLLEHYIKEVHSVVDVTDEFKKHGAIDNSEKMLQVDLTYDCYGQVKRTSRYFYKEEWEESQRDGYFLA